METGSTARIALLPLLLLLCLISSVAVQAEEITVSHEYVVDTYAIHDDFIFSTPVASLFLCRCDTQAVYFTVQNTGTQTQTFGIRSDGLTFGSSSAVLAPGEQVNFVGYIEASCSADRQKAVTVVAASASGLEKIIELPVSHTDCQNLFVALERPSIQTGVCEPQNASLLIRNTGNHVETYSISADAFTQYIRVAADSITLQSGTQTNIPMLYDFSCDQFGEKEIVFTVEAQGSRLQAQITQAINITYDYDFTVAGNELFACSESTLESSILLTNNNDFANEFTLELKGPSFVSLKNDSVTLAPHEQIALPLLVETSNRAGSFPVKIYATSTYGHLTQELDLNLTLENCFDFSDRLHLTPKKILACGTDEFTHEFSITQRGSQDTQVELIIDGPDFVYVDESHVDIGANQTVTIPLRFTIPRNLTQTYAVSIDAYHRGELFATDNFRLETVDEYVCHEIVPLQKSVSVRYDQGSFTVPLKNTGMMYAEYLVAAEGLPSYLDLQTSYFTAGKTQRVDLNFSIDREVLTQVAYDYNNGSIIGLSASPVITIIEPTSGASYTYALVVEFKDYSWFHKVAASFTQTMEDLLVRFVALPICVMMFIGVTSLFMVLAIVALLQSLLQKRNFDLHKKAAFSIGLLWVIACAVVLLLYGLPSGDGVYTSYDLSNDTATFIQLAEDRPKTIDLTALFVDPDGNIKTYGVYAIDQGIFAYEVHDGSLRLTPKKDWFGTSHMQLYATDTYNATAISEQIAVEVLPVEDYSAKQFLFAFCDYFLLLALLLLGLSIVVLASLRPRTKEKQKLLTEIK